MSNTNYEKYLKYKLKYLELKNELEGGNNELEGGAGGADKADGPITITINSSNEIYDLETQILNEVKKVNGDIDSLESGLAESQTRSALLKAKIADLEKLQVVKPALPPAKPPAVVKLALPPAPLAPAAPAPPVKKAPAPAPVISAAAAAAGTKSVADAANSERELLKKELTRLFIKSSKSLTPDEKKRYEEVKRLLSKK